MNGTVDDRYFEWLYGQIGSVRNRNPARSYWELMRQLYVKEFIWLVPNDDNRVEDGRELRLEFIKEQGDDEVTSDWMNLGCSMLEMLLGLARRAEFECDVHTFREWFWVFIDNMGLKGFNDATYSNDRAQTVDEAMDRVIYRTYSPSGRGGLFPLQHTVNDQRHVELRYQMSEYLLERYPL